MVHSEPRLAEILLAFGADLRIKNAKGQKPDQVAAQCGNRALAEFIKAVHRGKRKLPPMEAILGESRRAKTAADDVLEQRLSAVEEALQ
jgi:hypothetical protein